MMHRFLVIFTLLAGAASPQTDQTKAMQRWVDAKFLGHPEAFTEEPNVVLHLNPAAFSQGTIDGHSLLIVRQSFRDGVAMRAPGEVEVHVPAGALSFSTVLGTDSNDIGYYSNAGRGSVVATVTADGHEIYRSPVLHEGLAGIPLTIDLHRAKQFSLLLTPVGERPPTYQKEWDQADWADAKVILADGQVLPLSGLPVGPLKQSESPEAPFSFRYGGKLSSDLLPEWRVERLTKQLDAQRTKYTTTYTDPTSLLTLRCEAIAYSDFPTVEWTLYFKNNGTTRTAILDDLKPLDTTFDRGMESRLLLHHSKGSTSAATDYQPLVSSFDSEAKQHFASIGGRPTDGDMPYFNLEWPGRGIIFALGWPGQWALDVSRDKAMQVRVAGGQETTHFWLAPGEEVRTPLAVVQFWSGDWIDGQNLWRRWMVAHNLPRLRGQLPPPQIAASSAHFTVEMQEANETNQKQFLMQMLNAHVPIDHWWMDAGWYRYQKVWPNVGTWEVDPVRFPHGLRPITDVAHEHGVKSIVWFEPERVTKGTWLFERHPEWLIGPDGKDKLLFLGNKEAAQWLLDHVSELISTQGIDVYRQDFNFEPLDRWRSHDAADRQGITEIQHVEGYLAFFDGLRSRFPGLLIDTCASGGRRNDLETLRRAVPLWRSDYPYGADPMQMQTYGLSLWEPYFGTAAGSLDTYTFRSEMTPAIGLGPDPKLQGETQRQQLLLLSQWRTVADFYYGDFVPLTEYSADDTAWMAWQWGRPDGTAGVVQAFRRAKSAYDVAHFKLRGLNPGADYRIVNLDSPAAVRMSGKDLLAKGLPVSIQAAPGAVIYKYEVVGGSVQKLK